MDVPEELRKQAESLWLDLTTVYDPPKLLAEALLSERLAQKERDAKIAAGFDDGDPKLDFSCAAGTISRAISGQQ